MRGAIFCRFSYYGKLRKSGLPFHAFGYGKTMAGAQFPVGIAHFFILQKENIWLRRNTGIGLERKPRHSL
jgi:hypothetical protein